MVQIKFQTLNKLKGVLLGRTPFLFPKIIIAVQGANQCRQFQHL